MQLMQRIEPETKKTFELEEFLFHYINEDGLTVLCMTDKTIQKKIAFAFMQDVRKTVLGSYTQRELENAKAYSLSTFTDKLREKLVLLMKSLTNIYRLSIIATQCLLMTKLRNW